MSAVYTYNVQTAIGSNRVAPIPIEHYNAVMWNDGGLWSTVIGHEWAVNLLAGALARDKLAHAYLLTGPQHVGKTHLARTMAQLLNCEEVNTTSSDLASPCQNCRTCQLITRDVHPDVRLIAPTRSRSGRVETLRIGQVRELQRELSLSPLEARYRVPILTRFERASLGAANALLKTLEEPPSRVVLILTAESTEALLPTIVSRCQILPLRPLPVKTVEEALLFKWGAEEETAHRLAHLSSGRLGLALKWLDDPESLDKRETRLNQMEQCLGADRIENFNLAQNLTTPKAVTSIRETLELWLGWWRDVLLMAGASTSMLPITNVDRTETIRDASMRYGVSRASEGVQNIVLALQQLDQNANPRLVVEMLLLKLRKLSH
ncbi:MAG: DNA polymerase III subunit delta' C-terminal domain-containing protein [Chloroflexota bacterium]